MKVKIKNVFATLVLVLYCCCVNNVKTDFFLKKLISRKTTTFPVEKNSEL